MARNRVHPAPLASFPREDTPNGYRIRLNIDPVTDGPTFILHSGPRTAPNPHAHQFEYHTCHEENFLLNGEANFAGWYSWRALGYLAHPPYWWHPAGYRWEMAVDILIRLDAPVDFTYQDIPADWDRREYIAPESPHWCKNRAVSNQCLDDIPWEPVLLNNGAPAGFDAKRVWDHHETGRTTWLMRAPAGWRGTGTAPAGEEELFLLGGDLTFQGGQSVTLRGDGYACDAERTLVGGADTSSQGGFTAIRWTTTDHWRLPPVRF